MLTRPLWPSPSVKNPNSHCPSINLVPPRHLDQVAIDTKVSTAQYVNKNSWNIWNPFVEKNLETKKCDNNNKIFFAISEPRTKGIGALGKFAIGKLTKLANAVKPRPHHFQRKPQKPSYKPPSYKPRGKPSYQNPASALFQRLARPWFGWKDIRYGRCHILV